MSNFFDSEIIKNELKEIDHLQKEICENLLDFGEASQENKLQHIDKLSRLLEKQKIMYTRLSLSDDPKAIEMKAYLNDTLSFLGVPPSVDMISLFDNLSETIEALKEHISS
jgi:hypothetical protein